MDAPEQELRKGASTSRLSPSSGQVGRVSRPGIYNQAKLPSRVTNAARTVHMGDCAAAGGRIWMVVVVVRIEMVAAVAFRARLVRVGKAGRRHPAEHLQNVKPPQPPIATEPTHSAA
jgi:uncharacterized iron-regulated membrane protein